MKKGWIFVVLILVSVPLIITGLVIANKKTTEKLVVPAPKRSEEIPIETKKESWRIVFTSSDKIMKREGVEQKGFFDLEVLSLLESADKKNLTISYISANGKTKTMALSRDDTRKKFYSGWFENTHPNKKRDNIKIYLLEDTVSEYESTDTVTGKKTKILPAFSGYTGEGEMAVKIFKRVSSG